MGVSNDIKHNLGVSNDLKTNLGVSNDIKNNLGVSNDLKNNLGVSNDIKNNLGVSNDIKNNLGVSTNNSCRETPKLGVFTKGNTHWKAKSLGSIINQFKRICTIKTKSLKLDLVWQPRFYDHIIHSDYEMECIRKYIKENPENWMINE